MLRQVPLLLLIPLALFSCREGSHSSRTPPPAVAPDDASPVTKQSDASALLKDPARFDCSSDADCMNSCAYGAVNKTWYAKAETDPGMRECEDGCANQISGPPRCQEGSCVAYQVDPHDESIITVRTHCTRVEVVR